MKKKLIKSSILIFSVLLLASCSKEQEVQPQPSNQQEKVDSESIHFDLKEDNAANFQLKEEQSTTEGSFSSTDVGMEGVTPAQEGEIVEIGKPEGTTESMEGTEINNLEDAESLLNSGGNQTLPSYEEEPETQYPASTYQFNLLEPKLSSQEVQLWVEERKKEKGGYIRVDGEKKLLLISGGEQPNTGYSLRLNGVYDKGDGIEVHFSTVEPGDKMTLQVVTYPTLLISIPKTDKQIKFIENL